MGFSLAGIKPRTRLPFVGGLLGVLCLPGLLGCGGVPPEVPPVQSHKVLFRGCTVLQQTDAGVVCLTSAISQTMLWVADRPCDSIELVEDGASIAVSSEWIEDGCQIWPSAHSSKQTSTYAIRERKSGKTLWSLNYDRSKPWLLELTDRMWRRAELDLQGLTWADPTVAVAYEHPAVRIDRAYATALMLMRQGKKEESLRAFAEIQELAASAGYPSISLNVAFHRAQLLRYVGLPEEAGLVLAEIRPLLVPGHSELQSMLAWNEGLNQRAQEHFAESEQQIHQAVVTAKRLHIVQQLLIFMPMWADLLMALGKNQDAHEVVKSVPLDSIELGMAASVYTSLGELELQLQQMRPRVSGNVQAGEPSAAAALLLRALEANKEVPNRTNEALLHMDLALTNFLDGRREQANSELLKVIAKSGSLTNQQHMELLDLQARIAIDDNKLDKAKALLEQLESHSKQYEGDQRNLFACRAAVGRVEIKAKSEKSALVVSTEMPKCIGSSAKLTYYDKAALVQRLRDAGVQQ